MGIIRKSIGVVAGLFVLGSLAENNTHSTIGQVSTGSQQQISATGENKGGANVSQKVISAAFNNVIDTQCHVTMNGFSRLSTGMSYDTAVRVLGCSGNEMSRSDMAGFTTIDYAWDGEGMLGANMNAMFQNGGLVTKSQFGLR